MDLYREVQTTVFLCKEGIVLYFYCENCDLGLLAAVFSPNGRFTFTQDFLLCQPGWLQIILAEKLYITTIGFFLYCFASKYLHFICILVVQLLFNLGLKIAQTQR